VDRLITTTPPNGDDAGAFTYIARSVVYLYQELLPMLDLPATTVSAAGIYTITAVVSITKL
jgi:hypothetical protein